MDNKYFHFESKPCQSLNELYGEIFRRINPIHELYNKHELLINQLLPRSKGLLFFKSFITQTNTVLYNLSLHDSIWNMDKYFIRYRPLFVPARQFANYLTLETRFKAEYLCGQKTILNPEIYSI